MNVHITHSIVWRSDERESAVFLAEILGLPDPSHLGSMLEVLTQKEGSANSQHYAFLVSEEEFDQVCCHLRGWGRRHWSDLGKQYPGEIYRHHGGRATYFEDPGGQLIEVTTKSPYS